MNYFIDNTIGKDGKINAIDQNLQKFEQHEKLTNSPVDKNSRLTQAADRTLFTGECFGGIDFGGDGAKGD